MNFPKAAISQYHGLFLSLFLSVLFHFVLFLFVVFFFFFKLLYSEKKKACYKLNSLLCFIFFFKKNKLRAKTKKRKAETKVERCYLKASSSVSNFALSSRTESERQSLMKGYCSFICNS